MPFTIYRLSDIPVLMFVQSGYRVAAEAASVLSNLTAALDAQPEPVFLIIDVRALSVDLDELARTASAAARKEGTLLHHPNLRENLLVTSDGMLKLAVYGMRSAMFGGVVIRPFSTQEEALAYCHMQIAASAGEISDQEKTG